jgi:ketosteroid isomerase-like protein
MDTEQKKELVRSTWQTLLVKGDVEGALGNFTDDIEWWICGNLPGTSGTKKGKQEIRKWFSSGPNVFPNGMSSEVRYSHVDGDTVIAEIRNRGEVSNGKVYDNYYCFVFILKDGRIHRIREYVDLLTLTEAMSGLSA